MTQKSNLDKLKVKGSLSTGVGSNVVILHIVQNVMKLVAALGERFLWVMEYRTPLAGPLILLFISTFFISGACNGLNTLIIDEPQESRHSYGSIESG
jgi:hypothetical protein